MIEQVVFVHLGIYTYTQHIHIHVTTLKEKSHAFERKQDGCVGGCGGRKGKRENVVILL